MPNDFSNLIGDYVTFPSKEFEKLGADITSKDIKVFIIDEYEAIRTEHCKKYDDLRDWLTEYKKSYKRLSISDVIISECINTDPNWKRGIVVIINGNNGTTKVSKESINNAVDIISYLESTIATRAWLSYASMRSDVYYYCISFDLKMD